MPPSPHPPANASSRFYLVARTLSMFGDRFNELAVPIIVLATTDSPVTAGIVTAANRVPALLFALPIGALVDRVSRHRLMLVSDYGRAVALIPLVVSLAIGDVPVPLLTAIMFMVGIGDLVFLTSARAFMVTLVGRDRLVAANGKLEAGDAIATLSGPAIGALVLQVFGAATAIAVNAVSFLASAALLQQIPGESSSPSPVARAGRKAELLAGTRAIWRVPEQRAIQSVLMILHLLAGGVVLVVIALTRDVLGLSSIETGLVLAGAGAGGLLSSLLVAPRIEHRHWGPVLAVLFTISAVGMIGLALARGTAGAFVANAVLDGAVALAFVVAGSTRQALTPDALLGRVGSASFLLTTAAATLGALLAGALISGIGHRETLGAMSVLFLVAAMPLWRMPLARVPLRDLSPIDTT